MPTWTWNMPTWAWAAQLHAPHNTIHEYPAAKDNNMISQPDFTESHPAPRLPRKAAAASTASKATTGLYRESPSAAPCHAKPPWRPRRPRRQPDSTESHQVPRLPCKAAAASTASKATTGLYRESPSPACHAKPPRRQRRPRRQPDSTESHQVPCLPRKAATASTASKATTGLYREPSAAPATRSRRGVNGCHAKPPRRQRHPRRQPDSTESHQVPGLPRKAAAASTASKATTGLYRESNSVQATTGLYTESHQVPRLPRKATAASTASKATTGLYRESPSAAPATQSRRGVNGVQGDNRTLQRATKCRGERQVDRDKLIETSWYRQVDRDKLIETGWRRQVDRDKPIETSW